MHPTNNALLLLLLLLLLWYRPTFCNHPRSATVRPRAPSVEEPSCIMRQSNIHKQTHDPQHDKHTSTTPPQTFTCIDPPNQHRHIILIQIRIHTYSHANSTPSTTMTGPACLHLPARSRTPQATPPIPPSLFPPPPPSSLSLCFSQ